MTKVDAPTNGHEQLFEDTEVVRAKYVIGADGGKSWTRKQLGYAMEGNRTESIWGVIDLVVISDFPE